MIGKTLGHYQITSQIGKGGMGEVFQAKDQVLGREVALKVLPEEFARDTDRVARFQREAKVLASLNHPNIAAIHGLEQFEGKKFLVLELVEGQTLADQIKRGPIPVEQSLKLALQIAEALEAAHEKGVIHRDLKPANIKVTPDGKVKVLDFGLAKAYAGEQEQVNLSNSPTLSDAATQQGVILGTAAYMSPEQARGRAVDKRADIWAFGCVLYEMLTGRVAFRGEDVSEILASVIKGDVKLDLLPVNLHPRLREVTVRCLQKDLKRRYRDIADAQFEIEQALSDPGGVLVKPVMAAEPWRKLRTIFPWVAATIVLTAIIAAIAGWKLKPPDPKQVMRFDFDLPRDQEFSSLLEPVLAVSPDGKQFVYSTTKGLYLRSVDDLTARLISGSEGITAWPFFSPDGKWIGYFSGADRKLKKIAINGGAPIALCDVALFTGASWAPDNTIVYGRFPSDIMRISADGGAPESLIKVKSGFLYYPQILPDGKSMLYAAGATATQMKTMVRSFKSGESNELFPGVLARYLPTGHIVYWLANSSSLFAIPFDLKTLRVVGGQIPMIEGVLRSQSSMQYAVSDSGTLLYVPTESGASAVPRTLVWVDRNGKEEPISAAPNVYSTPKISPDGTRLALTVGADENADIWIWDLVRNTLTRLTIDNGEDEYPLWSQDGKKIVFSGRGEPNDALLWKEADGTGEIEKLGSPSVIGIHPLSWSADGKTIVCEGFSGDTGLMDISALSVADDRSIKPLLRGKFNETQPQISPSGKSMAYTSDESGQREVYVRPFPNVNSGKWQVSTGGGQKPRWSPDGRELFYRNNDMVLVVAVETETIFRVGLPRELFRGVYFSDSDQDWDISPDGRRFLMMKQAGTTQSASEGPRKINIVLNWFEELKQRLPVK